MNDGFESRSLDDLLSAKSNLVGYFYNDTQAPHASARAGLSPIPPEHTSWVEEQRAWRQTAVMFDQSHHMPELFVRGKDGLRLLNSIGVNSFNNFVPGRVRQFIGCNHRGQVIGECILYYLEDGTLELVSGRPLQSWVTYQAEKGGYDVQLTHDPSTSSAAPERQRTKFRFGMDGPNAADIFTDAVEGTAPEIAFFRTGNVRIAGCEVLALRHGMAGHKGVELSGRFEDGPKVRAAILDAGRKRGLRQGGLTTYFSSPVESGWIGSPMPAIYTSPEMRDYRAWLPATSWEANLQLGGSFISDDLEDYYVTPWDCGTERNIKFDHDFIGRAALENLVQAPRRTRRTLVWNEDDVARVHRSLVEDDLPFKLIRLPVSQYAYQQNDFVRTPAGTLAGSAVYHAYSVNERAYLSLAHIHVDQAEIGTELVMTWGEPGGGSRKAHVERHRQTDIRVTVAPAPYAETVRRIKHGVIG